MIGVGTLATLNDAGLLCCGMARRNCTIVNLVEAESNYAAALSVSQLGACPASSAACDASSGTRRSLNFGQVTLSATLNLGSCLDFGPKKYLAAE